MSDWFEADSGAEQDGRAIWMIIDESAFVRAQFKEILGHYSLRVLEARDVIRAVDLLSAQQGIQLIICDVNLLRMNGAALLDSMRHALESKPALYLLSEESKVELLSDAEKFGADGWVTKPPMAQHLKLIAEKFK